MTPLATYRLQLHRDFPFAAAEAIVPYLHALGVSHVYASPITTAVAGSRHGYDVVDPTRVNPELGGEEGLRSLVAALRERGMGLVIDIVPNHMGVAGGENRWWNDVLRNGEHSAFAPFFDIDWSRKLLLPMLGGPLAQVLAAGGIAIERDGGEPRLAIHGEHFVPIRPEDHAALPASEDGEGLAALLERQHYRLAWWRTADDELNWRRFFTITELAGVRVEDDAVFEATHQLYFRLYGEELVDGLRIDHVDGLADPGGYCRKLRQRLDAIPRPGDAPQGRAYVVVEKILGSGEQLPRNWGIDGTSGYDFMEEVAAVLHDPAGKEPLDALWREFSGRAMSFADEELAARRELLEWSFDGQLRGCVEAFYRLARSRTETAEWTRAMLRRALTRVLWTFPVYRSYTPGDAAPGQPDMLAAVLAAARRLLPPGEADGAERIIAWLGEEEGEERADPLLRDARRKFQQLSAPIAAKAVEDTAFYRHGRLLSRADVGFDPARFSLPVDAFHETCAMRARALPTAMLATATHDHKRGEDVRARLAVLSAIAGEWSAVVARWDALAGGAGSKVDPADRYMLYQTAYGAWPEGLAPDDEEGVADYAARLGAWQKKALREGKLRSDWKTPDEPYEARCADWLAEAFGPRRGGGFLQDLHRFVRRTQAASLANTLAQVALRCTVPGVPDCYQGTELADHSLVDPDNRRPVDYARRAALLAGGSGTDAKLDLLHRLLRLRRDNAELFRHGDYRPLVARGPRAGNVLAFSRQAGGRMLTCAVALRCGPALLGRSEPIPEVSWWGATAIESGEGAGTLAAADLFAASPVHVALRS